MPETKENKPNWSQKLQARWQLKSGWQVLFVLITFACTGFSVLFLKEPLYTLAGIDEQTPLWWRALFYCLTVLPAYQVILLIWGFLFGQFQFFWNFEKRLFSRFISFFRR
jgi:hypothetical protein